MTWATRHLPLVAAFLLQGSCLGAVYHVDSQGGLDTNKGTDTTSPWKSIERVNEARLQPGDKVLFRRDGVYLGNLAPHGSGAIDSPITLGAYGEGEKPVLDAKGVIEPKQAASATIRLFNQQHWVIRDIEVRNHAPGETPLPRRVQEHKEQVPVLSTKYGVLIEGRDCGVLRGISLIDLEVCDVNGNMGNKDSGGIHLVITRSSKRKARVPSRFEDVLIEGCHIHDVDRTGISNRSEWDARSLNSKWGEKLPSVRADREKGRRKTHSWFPSTGVIVRNNRIERVGANGVILRVAERPLFEHNTLVNCGLRGSGNAFFFFNCDDALCQHNEASLTRFNESGDSWDGRKDRDAGGFDSDYLCKRSTFQYNYSHDNEFGAILVCRRTDASTFNDGTVVRYNVFENNGRHSIRLSGRVTNTRIYNNVIFSDVEQPASHLVWHKSWGGFADQTLYANNVFVHSGGGSKIDLEESTKNSFSHNLYLGIDEWDQLKDPSALNAAPEFKGPLPPIGSRVSRLEAYRPATLSPLLGSGTRLPGHADRDLLGGEVASGDAISRGAFQSPQ